LFALPTGILGAGFVDEIKKTKEASLADSRAQEMEDLINSGSTLPGVFIMTLGWSFLF